MDLRYNDIFLKGENQGKEKEKERRTIEIISNCLKQNLSLEKIASIAVISVEEVKQYIKDNHLDKKKTKKRERKAPPLFLFFFYLSIFLDGATKILI